jgi:type VI secretion system secreted protein VgrG
MPTEEAARIAEVTSPLGPDVLLFHRMTATEEIGRQFHFELDLLSEDAEIAMDDVLGQPMTVKLLTRDEGERFFNGLVSRFSRVGADHEYTRYRAVLRPWLWFLTRTADCRIYQDVTAVEVIKDVFDRHGFTDLEDTLTGTYRKWVNCVQYRETDFNFVSRLMEQEGIYYYFKHEDGKHMLVLADDSASHDPAEGYDEVPFVPATSTSHHDEHLHSFSITREVHPCDYALGDFDFEKPKADLNVMRNIPREHSMAEFEIYDYPGEYVEAADGESYAGRRIEELQAGFERVRGAGSVRGITVGAVFDLTGHPWESENRSYLVLSSTHEIQVDQYRTGSAAGGSSCTVTFVGMDSQSPYRSARITPKPVVQGPQTAIVVGKSGEEIWTDKYGRVKVQFHWDRHGESDENSSCWTRVSQNWAGKNWGGMFIPHIGQEVIVEFLEGDPDRPIITGRVYNADNMAPEGLPGAQTQSVIRDHGGNEVIMEGADGSQFIHLRQVCGNEVLMNAPTPDIHVKQEDGNEILMDPDGIQIRDSYGNELVFDAGTGFIRLASPTHNSFMELGKSIVWNTDSDNESLISANAKHTILGYTHETFVGAKTEFSLAKRLTSVNGVDTKIYAALTIETAYAKHIKNVSRKIEIDSQKETQIIGGWGRQDHCQLVLTEGPPDVLLKAADNKLEMDVSKGIKITAKSGQDITIKSTSSIILDAPTVTFKGTTMLDGPEAEVNFKHHKD